MDVKSLRQLLAIRANGSFAKAARALGMSQPALSSAVSRLEDTLGVKLVDRTPNGSELTQIGALFAERASLIIAATEQMIRDSELLAGGETGIVRLGIGSAMRVDFMPRFVSALAQRYDRLGLHVQVSDRDKLLPMLMNRELDLIVCAPDAELAHSGLVVTEVLTTRVVAVAHPDHPLASERGISRERFAEFPSGGTSAQKYTNVTILGEAAGNLEKYVANDYDALWPVVLMGRATLLVPAFVAQPYIASGQVVEVDLQWAFEVSFAAITTRATHASPLISKLIACARDVGATLSGPR